MKRAERAAVAKGDTDPVRPVAGLVTSASPVAPVVSEGVDLSVPLDLTVENQAQKLSPLEQAWVNSKANDEANQNAWDEVVSK